MAMDVEEGEVDDVSDTEYECSPVTKSADTNIVKKRGHSKHSKHHTKRKHTKRSDAAAHHDAKASKSNGRKADSELSGHSKQKRECLSLKDYLSEEEDLRISTGNRKQDKRVDNENRFRKRRRKVERFSRPVVRLQCRYFMEGRCSKGDACPFAHDFEPPKKQELCKFYAVGVCSKGSSCVYLHGDFPCKFFHLSGRCNHGESCKFSHDRLTPETQALLDSAVGARDFSPDHDQHHDTDRPVRPMGSFLGEQGDMDYRFGKRSHFGQPTAPPNYGRLSPRAGHPDFDNCHNSVSYDNFREPRNLLGPRPPFDFHPHEVPPFGPDDHFRPMAPNHSVRPGFPPPRFPMGGPPRGPYPPHNLSGFPPREHGLIMRPPIGIRPNGPHDSSCPIDFPPFRPPFCAAPIPRPIPPFIPVPSHPPAEVIVNSELDKMAALLASSKPSQNCNNCALSPPSDPRAQSPNASSKSDKQPVDNLRSPTNTVELQPSTLDSPNTQTRKPSLSLSSPELNVVTNKPSNVVGSPISASWRLIPLDMHVKIPYPLMQLPMEDLPHRFEDPRLRGQLTTLRPQAKPASAITITDLSLNALGPDLSAEASTPESVEKVTATSKRRPIKLQLNEMASTFANAQSSLNPSPSTKSGDRSYLDDPRFRRRRIITVTTQSHLPSAPSDASFVTSE